MISYKNLFDALIDEEGIRSDIFKASKGKRNSYYVQKQVRDLTNDPDNPKLLSTIKRIKQMYIEGFELVPRNLTTINDGVKFKKRNIRKPSFFPEQIMTHGLVRVMEKAIKKGMYEFVCGSVPGRGAHYGKKFIEKWIKHDPKNTKYIAKLDIRKFFESIKHRPLKQWLKRNIKDKRFLTIVFKFLDIFIDGLALGYYISQWLANYLLQPLDHYIKQSIFLNEHGQPEKRNGRVGVAHMMRYMDDIVLFGANKKQLHVAVRRIEVFLKEKLGLSLKGNWQVFRFDFIDKNGKRRGRPLDYMGFKFYRDKTTIRRTIMLRACKKARKIAKKSKPTAHDSSSMLSYMGWFKHTDTYYVYTKHIKCNVNIRQLKRIVSSKQRRMRVCGNANYRQPDHQN